jgi:hypothetical protein
MEAPGFRGLDANIYESGFPIPPAAPPPPAAVRDDPKLVSNPWRDRIRIDRRARKYWEAPDGGAQSLGPMMAETLRGLRATPLLRLALDRLEEAGMLAPDARNRIETKLGGLLSTPPLSDWYAEGQSCRLGMKFLFGQENPLTIDRVVMNPGGMVLLSVIDSSRERPDLRGLRSCRDFLAEAENCPVEAWWLKLPEGLLERVP